MPNPFPGMDPYLEGDLWTSVHTDLCVEIAHQLAPKLRPKYIVLSTRRVVLASPEEQGPRNGARVPDVGVLSHREPAKGPKAAVATAPLILSAALPEAVPHVSVEIRDLARRRLVTCIEVLSPTNKYGTGREEYEAKRLEVLSGGAHLVEIDLLRRHPLSHERSASPRPLLRFHQPGGVPKQGGGVANPSGATAADHPGASASRRPRRSSRPASRADHRVRHHRLRRVNRLHPASARPAHAATGGLG